MDRETVMHKIIAILLLTVAGALAADFIPCTRWPNPVTTPDGKTWINPTVEQCMAAGWRLLPVMPATPEGKQIVSTAIVQDEKLATSLKYVVTYEAIPKPPDPPVYVPEVLTNILISPRVSAYFTTGGEFRAFGKLDVPATNMTAVKVSK